MNNTTNTRERQIRHTESATEFPRNYDMIVFCHLRWQFVYQRPQHLISRLSATMNILLVEEPVHLNSEESGKLIKVSDSLHILQPNVKDIESIGDILPQYVKNTSVPVGWFYSASFSPLLEQIKFESVIYDCMDELSLFKGAPIHLVNQEKYLMAHADIIYTGGKSLYESKKQLHDNVYCFPSSVDESHFAKALNGIKVPDDIAGIKSPIVGYYGVIDERIDLELLHNAAKQMPEVSFVMIGPLAKIEDSDLPRESNIHYLGMKSYAELPHYLKAFDIAMMPFALNDATKYISPTKTLEYMAAGRPIISTKIKDVVRDYSNCVSLIDNAAEFCAAIKNITQNTDRSELKKEYNAILEKTSWDNTANKMSSIIKEFAK